jgi:hypothetical protein
MQRVTLTPEQESQYVVKIYGTRGEVEAWIRWFKASELTRDMAQVNPQSVKRAVCKIAGTLESKRGPMGARGKPTTITLPPTADQFKSACEKLSLRFSAMTGDPESNLPRLELVEKVEAIS